MTDDAQDADARAMAGAEEDQDEAPHFQWWGVAAVLAWIMFRDRRLCDEIQSSANPNFCTLAQEIAWAEVRGGLPGPLFDQQGAQHQLLMMLKAPKLVGIGTPLADSKGNKAIGEEIEILCTYWRHIVFFVDARDPRARIVAATELLMGNAYKCYGTIHFSADAVMGLWLSPDQVAPKSKNEAAAARSLAAQMKNDPTMTIPKTFEWLAIAGFTLSDRRIQGHVLPAARRLNGWPEKAKAGRKPKASA